MGKGKAFYQMIYEHWWLGKQARLTSCPTMPFRRVTRIRLEGPQHFNYGTVYLTFDDGAELPIYTSNVRLLKPTKRDIVLKEITNGRK